MGGAFVLDDKQTPLPQVAVLLPLAPCLTGYRFCLYRHWLGSNATDLNPCLQFLQGVVVAPPPDDTVFSLSLSLLHPETFDPGSRACPVLRQRGSQTGFMPPMFAADNVWVRRYCTVTLSNYVR